MVREAAAGGELLPLWFARGGVLLAFSAFAGLHWAGMLEPAAPGRAWEAVGVAALVVVALLGAARLPRALGWVAATTGRAGGDRARAARGRPGRRVPAAGPLERARCPARAAASRRSPGVRVPYRGVDEWTRLAIGAGGALLTVLAALLAFWPRRRPHRVPGRGAARARDALRGARRGAELRGRVPARRAARAADARVPAAREAARARRPRGRPGRGRRRGRRADRGARAGRQRSLVRLRELGGRDGRARSRSRSAGTTTTARWTGRATAASCCASRPTGRRTGRRATSRCSTGAAGARIRAGAARYRPPSCRTTRPASARWSQHIEVTVRNLRSDSFVTAGIATEVDGESAYPIGGGVFNAPNGLEPRRLLLGRGLHAEPDRPAAARRRGHALRGLAALVRRDLPRGPGLDADDRSSRSIPVRVDWPLLGRAGRAGGRAVRRLRGARGTRPRAQRHGTRVDARAAAEGESRRRRSTTSSASRRCSATASATPSGRRRHPRRSPASCSTRRSASASSSPAPRRCCCGWPASRRASRRVSRRARSTTASASSSCATSTPTPGSRHGSRATAG